MAQQAIIKLNSQKIMNSVLTVVPYRRNPWLTSKWNKKHIFVNNWLLFDSEHESSQNPPVSDLDFIDFFIEYFEFVLLFSVDLV